MKNLRILLLSILLALTAIPAAAQQFSGLHMQSYAFRKVHPVGLKAIAGALEFTLNNSGERRQMKNIHAVVMKKGKPFLQGSCNDFTLERGTGKYRVAGKVKLPAGVSTFAAMAAVTTFKPDLYTVNFSLTLVHEDGSREEILRRDLPVSRFITGVNLTE